MTKRTPEGRRARRPLPPVTPMTAAEIDRLRIRTMAWLERPSFSSRELDLTYHGYARLLATIDALAPREIRVEAEVAEGSAG